MILISLLAIIIGILLGLLGGGGSILTVPALVYIAGLTPKAAIITSLIVVGCTSVIATLNHAKKQHVCWKTGGLFGSAGMAGAFLGGQLTAYIPEALLLVLLGIVMLVASFTMIFKSSPSTENNTANNQPICPAELPIFAILLDGFFLGMITGLVGVGGGFLLVPALTNLAHLPMHGAIGTSLFIIALQSSAALVGHAQHLNIDITLTLIVSLCAVLGSFIGAYIARFLPAQLLKRLFGYFVLILGSGLLYNELNTAIIIDIKNLITLYQEFILGLGSAIAFTFLYRLWLWLHTKTSKI